MSKKKGAVITLIVLLVAALAFGGFHFFTSLPEMRIAAAGNFHTVAIATDGSLWAWGRNDRGQLGDGTRTNRDRPVQIGTETDWVSVVAGGSHNVAIRADGSLWAWGRNDRGQLGDGTTYDRARPIQIETDADWTSVVAGSDFTFAIKEDGSLWHWGSRWFFVKHPESPDPPLWGEYQGYSTTPTQVGSETDWTSISADIRHVTATKVDGTLWAWGEVGRDDRDRIVVGFCEDTNTETIRRDITMRRVSFDPLQLGTDADWVSAAAGGYETLSIRADGTLWWWRAFPFGDFTGTDIAAPVQAWTDMTWATVVISGTWYLERAAAICTDGRLWVWGCRPWCDVCGDGTPESTEYLRPVQEETAADWISVSLGSNHIVATRADGSIWTSDGCFLNLRPILRRSF